MRVWTNVRCLGVGMMLLTVASQGLAAGMPTDKATPQMQAVLQQHAALQPKPIISLSPAEARRQPSPADAVIQLMQTKGNLAPDKLPAVGKVEMKAIPGPAGVIPARVYTPPGDGPFPVIVYYHGGGWVIADMDVYDSSARALCSMSGAVVVGIEYRRAPEAKFPAAHEDSYAALQYVFDHPNDFGGQPGKVAVAGESAGGNLATAVCLMAAQRGGKMPLHQALVYPIANYSTDTPSYQANADAKPLNKPMMEWFFKQYLNNPEDGNNVILSPLRATPAELKNLPPATIVTAEIDPLRDDGREYAKKLKAAGVDVDAKDYTGVTHEFFGMGAVVDEAKAAETFVSDRLKSALK